jgi:hypothetical protein
VSRIDPTDADYNFWKNGKTLTIVVPQSGDGFFIPAGRRGLWEGNHIIKQQLQRVLRDRYGIGTIGDNEFIEKQTPVKLMTTAEHRLDETAFHKR